MGGGAETPSRPLPPLSPFSPRPARHLLTAEVEIDGGGDLAALVPGLDLVQAAVRLDHVVYLQYDIVEVSVDLLRAEHSARVLGEPLVAAEPLDGRRRLGAQFALEQQPVAVILLAQLRLLREAGRKVLPTGAHRVRAAAAAASGGSRSCHGLPREAQGQWWSLR